MTAMVRRPKGSRLYTPMQALTSLLTGTGGTRHGITDPAARRVIFAMLAVLTESQQVRVLQQFGWKEHAEPVPPRLPAPDVKKDVAARP